jgi:hypothetical protein
MVEMGSKDFSFAKMEFLSKTEEAHKKMKEYKENPKAFEPPPKPKPSKREMVKKS